MAFAGDPAQARLSARVVYGGQSVVPAVCELTSVCGRLCRFKKGQIVGIHVDMAKRQASFSISKKTDGYTQQKMLRRVIHDLSDGLHFAVGGSSGGKLEIVCDLHEPPKRE